MGDTLRVPHPLQKQNRKG
jgi:hypothetical protein